MSGTSGDKSSGVVLFLSADLAGSTSYKAKSWHERDYSSGRPPWVNKFTDLYWRFPERLREEWAKSSGNPQRAPQFVKAIGDEILLATPVDTSQECVKALRAFMRCLKSFNLEYQGEGVSLELKGAAWIAGFPINNHRLVVQGEQTDYIGPSIDVGFRLARFSSRRRLVVSVDLALLIGSKNSGFKIYYEGREPLKGVLGDRPYPIIWIDTGIVRLEDSLVGIKKASCPRKDLNTFCRSFIESCGETSWLIVPYLRKDPAFGKVPVRHLRILQDWKTEDEKAANIGIGSSDPKGGRADQLNEILVRLKSLEEAHLRSSGPSRGGKRRVARKAAARKRTKDHHRGQRKRSR